MLRTPNVNYCHGKLWPLLHSPPNFGLLGSSADHTRHLILVPKGKYVGCSESKEHLCIQLTQKIDISQLVKSTNNVRKCLIQLCMKLSSNICNTSTTKFVHVGYRVDWLNSQAAVWYEEGISKLVSRYDKCLNVQGDYVEK
jgi:hypothetical protein